MAKPIVKLLNPEEVKSFLQNTGEFARVCYDSKGSATESIKLGLKCIEAGHMSTTRESRFKFNVSNISRVCSHQMVRHSVGVVFNQRSQRYVEEDEPSYVIPESIETNAATEYIYRDLMKECWNAYSRLLAAGLPPDDARFVLPNACTTELNVTFTSFEALTHFMHERLCYKASNEIREVARTMRDLVIAEEPLIAEFLEPKCVYRHHCPEAKSCGYYDRYKKYNGIS